MNTNDYYSEIFNFDSNCKVQEKVLENGKKIYVKRFSARYHEEDTALTMTLAMCTQIGQTDKIAKILSNIRISRVQNSLCDSKGELVSRSFIESILNSSDPEVRKFFDDCYKFVQEVNEVGIFGRLKDDKDGKKNG